MQNIPKTVYRIGILIQQVVNGGFIQYFDNNYGIFLYETKCDLEKIGAEKTVKIISKVAELINPNHLNEQQFLDYIVKNEYLIIESEISNQLNNLDDEFY